MGNHDAYPDQLIPVALDVTDTARDAAVVDLHYFGPAALTKAQTLSEEVPQVRFLIVEPGAFRTGLFGKDAAYLVLGGDAMSSAGMPSTGSVSGSATFRTNSPSGRNSGATRRSTSKPCP